LLEYICPMCGRENHMDMPDNLVGLPCRGCGMLLDGTSAELEIISHPHTQPVCPPEIMAIQ